MISGMRASSWPRGAEATEHKRAAEKAAQLVCDVGLITGVKLAPEKVDNIE
jgi:hypothetical protein